MPQLSILVCTVPERERKFKVLMEMLQAQIAALPDPKQVEILFDPQVGISVGTKRNRLMLLATGEYLCFVDDDDRIFGDYVVKILNALKTKPDAVGITVLLTTEGLRPEVHSHFALSSTSYHVDKDVGQITRGVCHLNPIRATIAKSIHFKDISNAEDMQWSSVINPKVRNSVNLKEPIYYYDFLPSKTLTQKPKPKAQSLPGLVHNAGRLRITKPVSVPNARRRR